MGSKFAALVEWMPNFFYNNRRFSRGSTVQWSPDVCRPDLRGCAFPTVPTTKGLVHASLAQGPSFCVLPVQTHVLLFLLKLAYISCQLYVL